MASTGFRELEVWRRAILLVEHCYRATKLFPRSELYGITGQVRRAAVSIAANVAEGHNRRTTRAFLNHVNIALGSQGEIETLLEIAERLGYLPPDEKSRLCDEVDAVARLLHGLRNALESKVSAGRGFSSPAT